MIALITVLSVAAAVQSVIPSSTNPETLYLAAGGLVGAFIRAFFIKHQATWGRETGFDLVIGVLIGLLWNVPAFGIWPPFDFSPTSSLVQRGAIVAVVAMISVEIIKRVLITWAPQFLEQKLGAVLPGAPKGAEVPKPPTP